MTDQYDIILSDPPWSYTGQQDKWAAAAKFYETMDFDDIVKIHVPFLNQLQDRGILFLWATSPLLNQAVNALSEWGLWFRGVAFVWEKTKPTEPEVRIGAQGVRPSIVKPVCEFVLAGSPVKKGRPLPLSDESIRQVVLAPKREHSRKPDEVQERIELMYPGTRKLEMFARHRREGWDAWGDEIDE